MKKTRLLVLGIGNILWADEGFGVRCAEELNARYEFDDDVVVMDGGTQGLYLLPYIEEARRLLVFDAVDYAMAPGEIMVATDDDVPRFMGAKKMSLHQTGFQEVLMCAGLKGNLPESLVLIGVQPEELEDFGGSLRESVRRQIPPALDIALEWITKWGVPHRPRRAQVERLNCASLEMQAYENGRPSADDACRVGDARFLASTGD